MVLFSSYFLIFFSVFFSSNVVVAILVKFFLGEVTEVSGPPMMPAAFGYQPMQLPQVWDVQMGVKKWVIAWVGWGGWDLSWVEVEV